MIRHVKISGCSGAGKSSLLAELAGRGHATVAEPGRRVVAEGVFPWDDMSGFLRRTLALASADREAALALPPPVFLDRGVVDAAVALAVSTGMEADGAILTAAPADRHVFMAPPWREIHAADEARRHGFDEAVAEYRRLVHAYPVLGYTVHPLPKLTVPQRADHVLARVAALSA